MWPITSSPRLDLGLESECHAVAFTVAVGFVFAFGFALTSASTSALQLIGISWPFWVGRINTVRFLTTGRQVLQVEQGLVALRVLRGPAGPRTS